MTMWGAEPVARGRSWLRSLVAWKKAVVAACAMGVSVVSVVAPAVKWVAAQEAQYVRVVQLEEVKRDLRRGQDEQLELSVYRWFKETRRQVRQIEEEAATRRLSQLERDKLDDLRDEVATWKSQLDAVRKRLGR